MVSSLLLANLFKRLLALFRRQGKIALKRGKWVGMEKYIKLVSKGTRTLNHLHTTRIMTKSFMHMHRYGLASKDVTSGRNKQGA